MKVKTIGRFLVIGCILALLIVGCGVTVSINSKANATPTQSIEAKMTQLAMVQPTLAQAAKVQPTITQAAPALPAMKEYTHPSNSFSMSVPVDWTIPTELSGYVFLASPDKNAFVGLYAENTGNALDAETFTKAINAFEFNTFSSIKNYKEVTRDVQADKGYAIIVKNLDMNAVPYNAATIYEQKGKALYIQIYMSAASAASQSGPILTAMKDSFKSYPASAESLSPFTSSLISYTDPDNLFSLSVSALWTKNDSNKDGLNIGYYPPDGNAVITLYKADLGKTVTRALADSYVLNLLKSAYRDMIVSKTEVLKNGSIQKTWAPKAGGFQAVIIYKWSGTTLFMLSWLVDTGFENIYGPVFNQSIASYQIPQ